MAKKSSVFDRLGNSTNSGGSVDLRQILSTKKMPQLAGGSEVMIGDEIDPFNEFSSKSTVEIQFEHLTFPRQGSFRTFSSEYSNNPLQSASRQHYRDQSPARVVYDGLPRERLSPVPIDINIPETSYPEEFENVSPLQFRHNRNSPSPPQWGQNNRRYSPGLQGSSSRSRSPIAQEHRSRSSARSRHTSGHIHGHSARSVYKSTSPLNKSYSGSSFHKYDNLEPIGRSRSPVTIRHGPQSPRGKNDFPTHLREDHLRRDPLFHTVSHDLDKIDYKASQYPDLQLSRDDHRMRSRSREHYQQRSPSREHQRSLRRGQQRRGQRSVSRERQRSPSREQHYSNNKNRQRSRSIDNHFKDKQRSRPTSNEHQRSISIEQPKTDSKRSSNQQEELFTIDEFVSQSSPNHQKERLSLSPVSVDHISSDDHTPSLTSISDEENDDDLKDKQVSVSPVSGASSIVKSEEESYVSLAWIPVDPKEEKTLERSNFPEDNQKESDQPLPPGEEEDPKDFTPRDFKDDVIDLRKIIQARKEGNLELALKKSPSTGNKKRKRGKNKVSCACCSSRRHELLKCQKFKRMTVKEKWRVFDLVKNACWKCLSSSHSSSDCGKKKPCNVNGCQELHHNSLHQNKRNKVVRQQVAKSTKDVDKHDQEIQNMLTMLRKQNERRERSRSPKSPSKLCPICRGLHNIRQCPEVKCSICKQGHYVKECPKLGCIRCNEKGHFSNECPIFKDIICIQCKGDHHIKDCPDRPNCRYCGKNDHSAAKCKACRNCGMEGHTGRKCPYKEPVCQDCQINHYNQVCPHTICKRCNEKGHFEVDCSICGHCGDRNHPSERCPQRKCNNCKIKGHDARDCSHKPGIICVECNENHHVWACLQRPCRVCYEIGHITEECPDAHKGIRCFKCQMFGHTINKCPFVECRNCGASGHLYKECKNKRNEFRNRGMMVEDEKKNVIAIDYNHVGAQTILETPSEEVSIVNSFMKTPPPEMNTKPLITYFHEKLHMKGRNPQLANQMMLYWQLAHHDEFSLRELFLRHYPCTRDTLRLLLVSELANAPSSCRPMDVTASDLLDETIDYFMPKPRSAMGLGPSLSSVSPMQPFFASAGSSSFNYTAQLTTSKEGSNEERLKSLQPLQEFIANKMRSLSSMFGIQESYVIEVSTTIQKILAEIGLCLFSMKQKFTLYGKESLSDTIHMKLANCHTKLPARVTPDYIETIVIDFMGEYCKDSDLF